MGKAQRALLTVLAGLAIAAAGAAAAGANWSKSVTGGPMAITTGKIAAPSGLAITRPSCAKAGFTLKFAWTPASPTTGISGYEIQRSSDGGSTWANEDGPVNPATASSYTTGNRTDWSTTYLFRVSSLGPGNWTAASTSVSYTTPTWFIFLCYGGGANAATQAQSPGSQLSTDTTQTDTSATDTTATDTTSTDTTTTTDTTKTDTTQTDTQTTDTTETTTTSGG